MLLRRKPITHFSCLLCGIEQLMPHASRGRDRRQRSMSGGGDLADAVLSLAAPAEPLWRRRLASAALESAAGAGAAVAAGDRAAAARGGDRRSDLGRRAGGRLCPAALAAARGREHGAAVAASSRLGAAAATAAGPRAPQRSARGAAHRTHAARAVA